MSIDEAQELVIEEKQVYQSFIFNKFIRKLQDFSTLAIIIQKSINIIFQHKQNDLHRHKM